MESEETALMNLISGQQRKNMENRPIDKVGGEEEEGEMYEESNIEIYNTCVKPCRRKWQATPVFLPGKSHGSRSLVGYFPWGSKESDTTERLHSLTHV